MLKGLLNRAQIPLSRIENSDILDRAKEYLDIYEGLQSELYVPVEPQHFFARCISDEIKSPIVHSPQTAEGLILSYLLKRRTPSLGDIEHLLSTDNLYSRYSLLLSSMVFHAKDAALTQFFLRDLVDTCRSTPSVQALDFQVMAAFFWFKAMNGSPRKDRAMEFKSIISSLEKLSQRRVSVGRHCAYEALVLSILNDTDKSLSLAIQAAESDEDFCTPLTAINNFYGAEYLEQGSPLPKFEPYYEVIEQRHSPLCIVTACDKKYFDLYFDGFCRRSAISQYALHLHCIDFRPDTRLIRQAARQAKINISLSYENYKGIRQGDAFGTWCATSRYRCLPHLLRKFPVVAVTDIDGIITPLLKELGAHIQPGIYGNVARTEEADDVRFPWNSIYAGNCIFHADDRVLKFADQLAAFCQAELPKRILARQRVHYFDQGVLASFIKARNVDVRPVPMFFQQGDMDTRQFSKHRPVQ